jgi:mono/diheme cytochrome c family protein
MKVGSPSHMVALGRFLTVCTAICLMAGSYSLYLSPAAQASSKAKRAQGAELFHEKGCEHCHGVDGVGTDRAPSLSGVGRTLGKPGIARQIHDGGKQMPAFRDALTNDEIQQLVEYLAAKKKKVAKPIIQARVSNLKN